MKRRDFFAAAGAAALLPAFLREAFACPPPNKRSEMSDDTSCGPLPKGADDVSAAFRKAVEMRKPLLVILVPVDDGQKWERGQAWGELLNHGSSATWQALGCAEVVCATLPALLALVPANRFAAPPAEGDFFAVVETTGVPTTASSFKATLPDYGDPYGRGGDWAKRQQEEKAIGEKRIAILGGLVETGILGANRSRLDERIAQSGPIGGLPSPDFHAAFLVKEGRGDDVVVAAQERLLRQRVRGSKWAHAGGCGTSVEGEDDNIGIACGMGHTPELSRRFLYWFTKAESDK